MRQVVNGDEGEQTMPMHFDDGTGFCPWHKRDSSFKVVHSIFHASPTFGSPMGSAAYRSSPEDSVRTGIVVMECLHCDKSVILLETEVQLPGEENSRIWRSMVSPQESPRELHESAPESVRGLYAEGSTCEKAKAFRAAGVMYRATVEEVVKDQKATGSKLWHKIESLKGKLADELVEDLHEARMLGNDSIHAGITYSEEEVTDGLDSSRRPSSSCKSNPSRSGQCGRLGRPGGPPRNED